MADYLELFGEDGYKKFIPIQKIAYVSALETGSTIFFSEGAHFSTHTPYIELKEAILSAKGATDQLISIDLTVPDRPTKRVFLGPNND